MVSFYPLKLYNIKPTPLPKTEDFEKQDFDLAKHFKRCHGARSTKRFGRKLLLS